MVKKSDDCPICGEYINIAVSGFRETPFITGKTYEYICFTCACTPRKAFTISLSVDDEIEYNKNKEILNNLEEMIADGFDKKRAEISIKTIKKLIKKK
jgi:hypothetical protein